MSKAVKTKSGRTLIVPSQHEDEVITRAAMSDADVKPLTDPQWDAVKPKLRRGRPRLASTKVLTTVRFDADVLEGMRSTGRGWQTRINQVMREWVISNTPATAKGVPKSATTVAGKLAVKQTKRDHEFA